MPRRAPQLTPVDPTPAALTAEQLVDDGVCKKHEAMRLLGCGETQLKEYVRGKKIKSWKEGRDRVYPRAGLKAYLATRAREEHAVNGTSDPVPIVVTRHTPQVKQPPASVPADIWRAGGFDEKRAARFLSLSKRAFRTLWKQMGWPRKRIRNTKKIVYPKSLIRDFLTTCEDA